MATNRNNNQNQYYQYGYNQNQYNNQYYAQQEQMQNEQYYAQQAQKQKEQAKKQAKIKKRNNAIALVATIGLAAGAIGGGVALWSKSKAEQTPGGSSTLVTNPNQTENPTPGTENPTPGTENPTPGTENPTPGTENPTPGTETQYTEAQYKTMAETKIKELATSYYASYSLSLPNFVIKGVDGTRGVVYATKDISNSVQREFLVINLKSVKNKSSYEGIYNAIKSADYTEITNVAPSEDLSSQVSATSYNTFVQNVLGNVLAVSSENCVVNSVYVSGVQLRTSFYNLQTGVVTSVIVEADSADMPAGAQMQLRVDTMNNLMESGNVEYTVALSSIAPSNTLGK